MDTRPISAVLAVAAYQLPVARDFTPDLGVATLIPPSADRVEISAEARRLASSQSDPELWGEVRYEYPHTDDPDLPWEVEHNDWMSLITKVFGGSGQNGTTDS